MRTAEEHYQIATLKNLSNPNGTRMDVILSAINEARKEAIEECAAKFDHWDDPNILVRDEILGLINELK